jgi:hypothetical protein
VVPVMMRARSLSMMVTRARRRSMMMTMMVAGARRFSGRRCRRMCRRQRNQ